MRLSWKAVALACILALAAAVTQPALAATNEASQAAVTAQASDQSNVTTNLIVAPKKKTPWYKSRTTKITAGSAGAGALVGGLVGGGKGAAVGALTGGAAGYIYDRKTRNRK